MKISLKWLSNYVDVSEFFTEPEKLSDLLTQAGLEVEEINDYGRQYENVFVGCVLKKDQHPDADRLSLCQVSTGGGVVHQIICGAKNHQEGDRVVVALPGAVLPGDFAIKKSKIRGVESNGMLCSESELGQADESPGIIILPEEAEVGQSYAEYSGLNDVVIELSVTPNRADCLSHFGLAREIACLLDRELRFPGEPLRTTSDSSKDKMTLSVNSDLCPRYSGRYIAGVKVGPSPTWLKQSLERIGVNSINNIVDVTNYVMMELGQPLHAFDAEELAGSQITVDLSKDQEKFTTLDGTELELTGQELMIRDGDKPVALAGVVGGLNSGVSEQTKNVFVESAFFTAASVRKTARKFGVETESGYRFSRGVDPQGTVKAMDRACALIQEVAGGEIYSDHHDHYPKPFVAQDIFIGTDFVAQKLGFPVEDKKFVDWMSRLGGQVEAENGAGQFRVTPPTYRVDLSADVDLVEEYGRLEGYDKIPEKMPNFDYQPTRHDPSYVLGQMVQKSWVGLGYQQAFNYAFLADHQQKDLFGDGEKFRKFGLNYPQEAVRVLNPLSEDHNVMRSSLLPGLIKNMAHNDRRETHQGRLFEEGYSFSGDSQGGYHQERRLALAAWGDPQRLWDSTCPLVFQVKSDVEQFLKELKSQSFRWEPMAAEDVPELFHPGQCVSLFYEGKTVGILATMHPQVCQSLKIRVSAVVAEFNLDLLLKGQPRSAKVKTPPKFPPIERDLAFTIPKELPAATVMAEMKKVAGKLLREIYVFDVYEGSNLEEGQRSIGFRLIYQNPQETMSDEQVLSLQESLINSVSQKYSIRVR